MYCIHRISSVYTVYVYSISATVPCAECVVMRLRDLETHYILFLVFFLTLQTLYKYLPTLRTVSFCQFLIRGPHSLGSRQFNHTCVTLAEHSRAPRASFSLMLAHLGALGRHVGPLGRHLVPLARHLIANMSENVPESSKTASRCLRHLFRASQKCKNRRKPTVFQCISLSRPSPKILEKCSQNFPS